MRKALLLAALVASLTAACSGPPGAGGPEKVVFQVAGGIQTSGPAAVNEILDLGLPPIHNLSGSTVRLRSVQLVSPPGAVRVLNIRAYRWQQVGVGWLQGAFGDLPKQCPREYVPYPVTAVVTPPRSDSAWMVVIALIISRPGTYYLRRVRISYVAGSERGWQYQNFSTVIIAGRAPLPRSGC